MTLNARTLRRYAAMTAVVAALAAGQARAADHLDTSSVVADPRADIGDLYAWTSPDGRRLNLAMTIVGPAFSDRLTYAFHVDSGPAFGRTTATTTVSCRFAGGEARCAAGKADSLRGDASRPEGLTGRNGRFRVFAGRRDDPFFNNVRGTREAYDFAADALKAGARLDDAGCPVFSAAVSQGILDRWRHTTGGPPQNMLAGWTSTALVVSVDLDLVSRGGKALAVWAETAARNGRVDRMGRPLTGNALLATLATEDVSNALKERYNRATPTASDPFVPEIEKTLALYDAFDGRCGNSFLADTNAGASRYLALAILMADDRLWVNGDARGCASLFAVELAALAGRKDMADDCGGRAPSYDAVDTYRALLVNGSVSGVEDGVDRDDRVHSDADFPFLAAPAQAAAWPKDR